MPLWATPTKAPGRAVLLRAAGSAAAVFGMGMASPSLAVSAPVAAIIAMVTLTVLLLAPYLAAIAIHNPRVQNSSGLTSFLVPSDWKDASVAV